MPYTIKTTLCFAGWEQGWTETFYWSQATTNLQTAEDTITPIAQKRAKCLAQGYQLTVVRNAVVINDSNQKVKRRTDLFEPRLPGNANWAAATPNLALYLLWQTSDNTLFKAQYMRGIPGALGENGKAPNLGYSNWYGAFQAWRSAMVTLGAGWLITSTSQPNTAVITGYVLNETSGIVTFTLASPGLPWPNGVGFKQRVYAQLPGKSPLDGSIVVIPADATHCTTAEPIGVHPFETGQLGIMQIKTQSLVTLAPTTGQGPPGMIHPQRIITHKTGSPSYASRGRAVARPKW